MDGPNVRPEPGYGAELNPQPQQGDTPTTHAPEAPAAAGLAVPEAISFRQLAALRQSAIEAGRSSGPIEASGDPASSSPAQGAGQSQSQGRQEPGKPQSSGAELAALEQLLGAYEQLGQKLLQQFSRQGVALEQHRNPQQLMALGALGAHIRLGLQALAASRP